MVRGVRRRHACRAGIKPSGSLAARSYLSWGEKLAAPRQGCIVVLKRGKGWQGHVTFFDREADGRLVCLGGNQSDKVCFATYRKLSSSGTAGLSNLRYRPLAYLSAS